LNRAIPHYSVPEVVAVDWDGVVANEEQTASLVRASARPYVSRGLYRASETNGYRLNQAIGQLPEDRAVAWYADLMAAADDTPFLYDDGADLLARLSETTTPHVIVTWSEQPTLALAKIAAAMRRTAGSVCVQVTESQFKGRHVARWEQNGGYDFTGVDEAGRPQAAFSGQRVRVLDNRARVFLGLPEDSGVGTWLRRPEAPPKHLAEQPHPEVSAQVSPISRLGDLAIVPAIQPGIEVAGFYPVYAPGITTDVPITGETTYADIMRAVRK
jgi:hypothetical protein